MFCAAAVTAQFVSGKATRDALFLASLDVTSLPPMLVATSACSIALVAANASASRRIAPASDRAGGLRRQRRAVPGRVAADLHAPTARRHPRLSAHFGRRPAARVGLLADCQRALRSAHREEALRADRGSGHPRRPAQRAARRTCCRVVRRRRRCCRCWRCCSSSAPGWSASLAGGSESVDDRADRRRSRRSDAAATSPGLRVVAEAPYLRNLAALVLLGTTAAALVDYVFKAQAVETFGRGDQLLRFFAIYYAATSFVTFLVQATSSRMVLERFGLAVTTSTPSLALLRRQRRQPGRAGIRQPGRRRAAASPSFRGSLFRAGYELFYTPIPARRKAAPPNRSSMSPSIVSATRSAAVWFARSLVLCRRCNRRRFSRLALGCSAAARLRREPAESRLHQHARAQPDSPGCRRRPAGGGDRTHPVADRRTMPAHRSRSASAGRCRAPSVRRRIDRSLDPTMRDILDLRSRDRDRVADVLRREEGLTSMLVPHVIPLLAWDRGRRASDVRAAEGRRGARGRTRGRAARSEPGLRRPPASGARVLGVRVAARGRRPDARPRRPALRGPLPGGPSLAAHRREEPARAHRPRADLRGRCCAKWRWAGRSGKAAGCWTTTSRRRARRSTRLSATAPARAWRTCSRCCRWCCRANRCRSPSAACRPTTSTCGAPRSSTSRASCRAPIRERLWPFLETASGEAVGTAARRESIADLLRSNQSIMLNLEELRRRDAAAPSS